MLVSVLVDQTSTEQYIVSLARKSRVRQTSNGHFYHNEIQSTPQPYIMEKGFVHLNAVLKSHNSEFFLTGFQPARQLLRIPPLQMELQAPEELRRPSPRHPSLPSLQKGFQPPQSLRQSPPRPPSLEKESPAPKSESLRLVQRPSRPPQQNFQTPTSMRQLPPPRSKGFQPSERLSQIQQQPQHPTLQQPRPSSQKGFHSPLPLRQPLPQQKGFQTSARQSQNRLGQKGFEQPQHLALHKPRPPLQKGFESPMPPRQPQQKGIQPFERLSQFNSSQKGFEQPQHLALQQPRPPLQKSFESPLPQPPPEQKGYQPSERLSQINRGQKGFQQPQHLALRQPRPPLQKGFQSPPPSRPPSSQHKGFLPSERLSQIIPAQQLAQRSNLQHQTSQPSSLSQGHFEPLQQNRLYHYASFGNQPIGSNKPKISGSYTIVNLTNIKLHNFNFYQIP